MTDSDWLVLRAMRPAIETLALRVAEPGKIAIDFGCGSQPYRPLFASHGLQYYGVDFEGGDIPILSNGRVDAPDSCADLVLSFQVLEHVRDVDRYLQEARRLLRRDGCLILSTHGNWLFHPHPEDHRRWTRQGLLAELRKNGFEIIECVPVLGPMAWTTLLRLTCGYQLLLKCPLLGRMLAKSLAVIMNLKGCVEDLITPEWVRGDNACVYVTLSRAGAPG
ncbi:MAG: class I SAM-dependent methyltransferase [Steroidobacteraceae bacterium]